MAAAALIGALLGLATGIYLVSTMLGFGIVGTVGAAIALTL